MKRVSLGVYIAIFAASLSACSLQEPAPDAAVMAEPIIAEEGIAKSTDSYCDPTNATDGIGGTGCVPIE